MDDETFFRSFTEGGTHWWGDFRFGPDEPASVAPGVELRVENGDVFVQVAPPVEVMVEIDGVPVAGRSVLLPTQMLRVGDSRDPLFEVDSDVWRRRVPWKRLSGVLAWVLVVLVATYQPDSR